MMKPAGVCIQEFADNIQKALNSEPAATTQVARKCTHGRTLPMPNSTTPIKPASRKNATSTSMYISGPITAPARLESSPQLAPNWNSISTPVTTPTATFRAKILLQYL